MDEIDIRTETVLDVVDKMDFSRRYCFGLGRTRLGEKDCSRAVGSTLIGFGD